jgi:hypothetical protein
MQADGKPTAADAKMEKQKKHAKKTNQTMA